MQLKNLSSKLPPYFLNSETFFKKFGVLDWGTFTTSHPVSYNHYDHWEKKGLASPLNYLSDERKLKRKDLRSVFPEFQQGVVFLFGYPGTTRNKYLNGLKMARYVLGLGGRDYHEVLPERLKIMASDLQKVFPGLEYKICVDTLPVLERDFAYQAGLGWFGKSSMLIHRKYGSYFLIGSLLLNQKVVKNKDDMQLETDHCGTCQLCVDACPTNAIDPHTRTIHSETCLSTYTIEVFKEKAPPTGHDRSDPYIFGCDICQEVCPWNQKDLLQNQLPCDFPITEGPYKIFQQKLSKVIADLSKLSNRSYRKLFHHTPLARTGRVGMLKNVLSYFKSGSNKLGR